MVLAKTEQGLKVFVLLLLSILLIIAITYGGISLYANIVENNSQVDLPKFPNINKAKYTFTFKTTGNILLTNEYNNIKPGVYELIGYWESNEKKYIYHDKELLIDESYFGDVIITARTK